MKMNTIIIPSLIVLTIVGLSIYRSTKSQSKQLPINTNQQQFLDTFHRPEKTVKTEEYCKERFTKNGLSKHWDFFKGHLKPEILTLPKSANESEMPLGQSKIGGQPDLPKNIEWFKEDNGKRLSFIAQINLSEVASFDKSKQLPSQGIIYFFYSAEQEAWGFDIKDKDKFKVFFYDGNLSEIKRQDFPKDLAEHARYKPCKLTFQSSVSLPNWEEDYVSSRLSETEKDKYLDITEDLDVESNKLLGHSDNIQGPMELECELVTNGLYCGDATGYNDPKAKELTKNAKTWTLLFQVDSNHKDAGMIWGDMGRLYFWIKKDDLKNKKFDKCWLILQCS
ncbi:MAG TPA: YwqG family protein [Chitinophagaceae bacterium]